MTEQDQVGVIMKGVIKAMRTWLKERTTTSPEYVKKEIKEISRRAGRLPRRTGKSPEEIIDYDDRGLPR